MGGVPLYLGMGLVVEVSKLSSEHQNQIRILFTD